jgi:hypothetical protein
MKERKNRIIARGEATGHCHVIIGEATINRQNGIFIEITGKAAIRHLLEKPWVEEGLEVWTKEHEDIQLEPGTYQYIPQIEYDPYEEKIRQVRD